jgi:hypothetical protein
LPTAKKKPLRCLTLSSMTRSPLVHTISESSKERRLSSRHGWELYLQCEWPQCAREFSLN